MKKQSEYLKYVFIPSESEKHAKALARANQSIVELQARKKALATDLKNQEESAAAEVAMLARYVNDGYDYRLIDCEWKLDDPERGRKSLYRTDTGEYVREAEMTNEDKQENLPLAG